MSFYFPTIGTGIYAAVLITMGTATRSPKGTPRMLLVSTSIIVFLYCGNSG